MAKTHKEVLKELLLDPEFKREYEAFEPEFALRRAIQLLRKVEDISQQELAEKLGTKQAYISRIERQPLNLSLAYLARLFDALNADFDLRVVPRDGSAPIKVRLAQGAGAPPTQPASVVARTMDVTWVDKRTLGIEKAREWKEKAGTEQDPFNKYFSLFVGYNIVYNLYAAARRDEKEDDKVRAVKAIELLDPHEREELIHAQLSSILSEYLCTVSGFLEEHWNWKGDRTGTGIRERLKRAFRQEDWLTTFEMLIKWLYKVRCNLFHGDKGYADRDQEELLRQSSALLEPILRAMTESYSRKYLRGPTD